MPEVTVADASGETLSMMDFDGYKVSLFGRTPDYITNVYKNLPNFKFRENDIFVASYPKAGSTWVGEILTMLLKRESRAVLENKWTVLEGTDPAEIDQFPSPRLMNSHLPLDRLPKDLLERKTKIVYVIRNYKDITVSMYNFMKGMVHYNYNGKWEDWLQLHLDGQITYADYFAYVRQWEEAIKNSGLPIHVVYYEDLKSDTLNEIKRLAKFYGIHHSDEVLKDISANCQFDAMKKRYTQTDTATATIRFKEGAGFFRKGVPGDWKNWYTVALNEKMNKIIRENMENYETSIHFGAKYEL